MRLMQRERGCAVKTEQCKGQPIRAGYCESRVDTKVARAPGEAMANVRETIAIVDANRARQADGSGPVLKPSAFGQAIAILQGVKRRHR